MMKKTIVTTGILSLLLFMPSFAHAGLIPCDGAEVKNAQGQVIEQECTFDSLIQLIQNIINFFAFVLSPVIAGIVMAYGGFLILTDGGNAARLKKAKGMFMDALIGLLIVWGAWVIVKTIMVLLGYDTSIFPSFF